MSATPPPPPGLEASGPLADVVVLDLSALLPGPFTTQMLGDLGADVIKVEPPRGDLTRSLRAFDVFSAPNRNKRSVVLDLKDDICRQACLRIAAVADVVVEGFRPGVVDRLGLAYDDVRRVRDDVIYCSISGFGQNGPMRSRPGHDGNYLAASGALSLSGHWLEAPRRSGLPVADLSSATFATISILAALHERDRTGRGAYLDVSMTDTATAFASFRGGARLDREPGARGHLLPTNDLFVGSDGVTFSVGAVEDHFWRGLRTVVSEVDQVILEARFDDEPGRREHGDELKVLLDRVFSTRPAADWIAMLGERDVPVERVLSLSEAVESEQAQARGLTADLGDQRHFLFPVLRDGKPMSGPIRRRPPALGAHTREVLAAVGSPPEEIAHCLGRAAAP